MPLPAHFPVCTSCWRGSQALPALCVVYCLLSLWFGSAHGRIRRSVCLSVCFCACRQVSHPWPRPRLPPCLLQCLSPAVIAILSDTPFLTVWFDGGLLPGGFFIGWLAGKFRIDGWQASSVSMAGRQVPYRWLAGKFRIDGW
jgi:hypothetical protein